MAPKKSAAKSPRTAVTPKSAEDQAQTAARPRVTRRRAPAAAPDVQAAAVEAPALPRPTPKARTPRVAAATEPVSKAAPAAARQVTAEDIRVRAYFLALESQGRGGSLDYWLRAERELRASDAAGD